MIGPVRLLNRDPAAVAVAEKVTGLLSSLSRALKNTLTVHLPGGLLERTILTFVMEPVGAVASKSTMPLQVVLNVIGYVFSPVEKSVVAIPLPRTAA